MSGLRSSDITPPTVKELRMLRCPSCAALRLRTMVAIEKGSVELEDICRRCGTKTRWTLDATSTTGYTIVEEGKRA